MAAFCSPHHFYHAAAAEPVAVKGFFQFLDNLQDDLHLQSVLQQSLNEQSAPTKKQQPLPVFTPRFDISETESAYHIQGELPGLTKDHLDIDFTDAQTITVRGKILRVAPSQTTEDVLVEDTPTPQSPASSTVDHHATVEDDFEDLAAETSSTSNSASAPATEKSTETKTEQKKPEQPEQQQQQQAKFWISERKFGQFARSFKFRKTVDVAAVSASLDSGVLSVVVPKKNESRKIFVQ